MTADLVQLFERSFRPLLRCGDREHGDFGCFDDDGAAGQWLASPLIQCSARRLVVARRTELDRVVDGILELIPELEVVRAGRGEMTHREWAGFDAALGGADLLVAESASLILSDREDEDRRLSLLPPRHLVAAPAARLVERMAEALIRSAALGGASSDLVFITGPSRTADIEKTLVLPAHGPAELYVAIIDPS